MTLGRIPVVEIGVLFNDVVGDVLGVVPDAPDKGRCPPCQPWQAKKIQPRHLSQHIFQEQELFITESNQDVTLISSQVGSLEEDLEVEDMPDKIRIVKRLYESIETPKCKKKRNYNQ